MECADNNRVSHQLMWAAISNSKLESWLLRLSPMCYTSFPERTRWHKKLTMVHMIGKFINRVFRNSVISDTIWIFSPSLLKRAHTGQTTLFHFLLASCVEKPWSTKCRNWLMRKSSTAMSMRSTSLVPWLYGGVCFTVSQKAGSFSHLEIKEGNSHWTAIAINIWGLNVGMFSTVKSFPLANSLVSFLKFEFCASKHLDRSFSTYTFNK